MMKVGLVANPTFNTVLFYLGLKVPGNRVDTPRGAQGVIPDMPSRDITDIVLDDEQLWACGY